jgi:hypothetical protein
VRGVRCELGIQLKAIKKAQRRMWPCAPRNNNALRTNSAVGLVIMNMNADDFPSGDTVAYLIF